MGGVRIVQRPRGLATAVLGIGLTALVAGAEPLAGDPETPELAAPPEFSEGLDLDPQGGPGEPIVLDGEEIPAPAVPALKGDGIERAWLAPAGSFAERVDRTRRTSLELGAWNLDPVAHAIAAGGGGKADPLARAEAAVRLAPDLPAARMRLARARWLHGENPTGAVLASVDAMKAIARHLEASLWFAGSGLWLLAVALVAGGLLAIFVAGLAALRHAAHDVGHLWFGRTPEFARFALLASALLVPLALGEGLLGLVLVVLAVGVVYGSAGQRVALALAIGAVVAGAYPVMRLAAATLDAFPGDPLARSAFSAASGLASPVDVARLRAAAASDSLAARGLAMHARRAGDLAEADALYQKLLGDAPADPVLLNNAANVRLELGHMEDALDLYRRSVEIEESPVVLFNLAQAYGRAFQVEDLNRTLAQAQRRDGELVATLTALQGSEAEGFVVDLPLPGEFMWRRLAASRRGDAIAAQMRAPLAPGRLGRDRNLAAAAAGLGFLLAAIFGARFDPTRSCPRCGARMCPRCDGNTGGEQCAGCTRLFFQPERTDRTLRLERVNALRDREQRLRRVGAIASVLLPGVAGLLARRPLASFLGTFLFALALAAVFWRGGVVPDPLVAGAAAHVAFLTIAVLAAVGYALVVATALASQRS
jgi:tetratricopeptide (TPR) repeat protein